MMVMIELRECTIFDDFCRIPVSCTLLFISCRKVSFQSLRKSFITVVRVLVLLSVRETLYNIYTN